MPNLSKRTDTAGKISKLKDTKIETLNRAIETQVFSCLYVLCCAEIEFRALCMWTSAVQVNISPDISRFAWFNNSFYTLFIYFVQTCTHKWMHVCVMHTQVCVMHTQVCVCVRMWCVMWVCTCTVATMWRAADNLCDLDLSFHKLSPGDRTHFARLQSKCFYQQRHSDNLCLTFKYIMLFSI